MNLIAGCEIGLGANRAPVDLVLIEPLVAEVAPTPPGAAGRSVTRWRREGSDRTWTPVRCSYPSD
ncbi:hypothetical protein AB6N24_18485 [Cellulomonas sp. 179-A 4D5 NHS]|uniref:hypothetical protein n=1 Tax=Cellulomonas sp. 179-A 4D5 NHS TaxID=3142378 RepID=UPI0039A1B909